MFDKKKKEEKGNKEANDEKKRETKETEKPKIEAPSEVKPEQSADSIDELKKQKEDLELLLSSLEDAYNEATISEKDYQEMKAQNQEKLNEINIKINEKMKEMGEVDEKEKEEQSLKQAKKVIREKKEAKPSATPVTQPAQPTPQQTQPPLQQPQPQPVQQPYPQPYQMPPPQPYPQYPPQFQYVLQNQQNQEEPKKGKRGRKSKKNSGWEQQMPQPTLQPILINLPPGFGQTQPQSQAPAQQKVEEKPKEMSKEPEQSQDTATPEAAPDDESVKGISNQIKRRIKDIVSQPRVITVTKDESKLDKIITQIEKMKAFLDVVKEENSSTDEMMRRMSENLGEVRTTSQSTERKSTELELKIEEMKETMAVLKPQRLSRALRENEEQIKDNTTKIEKIDDLTHTLMIRLNEIKASLEKLGSLENVAVMSKNIDKKILLITERERSIVRMSDKINGIFVDLSKKLEEFMFYKAKQDILDDVTKDLTRSMDEIRTNMEQKMATKDEINELRVLVSQQGMRPPIESSSPLEGGEEDKKSSQKAETKNIELSKLEDERDEIKEILELFEEQFKSGLIKKEEYEKSKKINSEKLKEIEKKIEQLKKNKTSNKSEETKNKEESTSENTSKEEKAESDSAPRNEEKTQTKDSEKDKKTEPDSAPKEEEKPEVQDSSKQEANDSNTTATQNTNKEQTTPKIKDSVEIPVVTKEEKAKTKNDKNNEEFKEEQEEETKSDEKPAQNKAKQNKNKTEGETDNKKEIEPAGTKSTKESMISALKESFEKGKISKEAFERTLRILERK